MSGLILFREVPQEYVHEDYLHWWAGMSERERDRHTAMAVHNVLTASGRSQLLLFAGTSTGGTAPFAQYFATGTFPINSVSPGDTQVRGEIARVATGSAPIIATTFVDIQFVLGLGVSTGTITNAGIYGINAVSSVGGAGTLTTHALVNPSLVIGSGQAYFVDYILTLV